MNVTKVLCLSLLTMIGSSLLGGVTIAKRPWPSVFQDQATMILGYLVPAYKRNPTGVRISYVARCDAAGRLPLIPPVRLQNASSSSTVLEAARSIFSSDYNTAVSHDELGNVSIQIGNVPNALLRTKIATLRLTEMEAYNPDDAIAAINATKEVQKAATTLRLEPAPGVLIHLVQWPAQGGPHIPLVLKNLTVNQILNMIAGRFKGAVLYGVCTQGPQPRYYSIEFLDSGVWS
jgi:hypothetical protein